MHHPFDPARSIVRPWKQDTKRDVLDRDGAEQLAHELDAFWHEQGYPHARHWVEETTVPRVGDVITIRSNLVNGIPPSKPGA
jgi:hypothetical protein